MCRMVIVDNKKLLFGELVKSRLFHGTKQYWRDVINADLHMYVKSLNVHTYRSLGKFGVKKFLLDTRYDENLTHENFLTTKK